LRKQPTPRNGDAVRGDGASGAAIAEDHVWSVEKIVSLLR
jgi:hypothetical protein